MKKFMFWALGLALALASFSCDIDFDFDDDNDNGPCIRGNGSRVSRVLNLPDFNSIVLEIPAEVIITQGNTRQVTVEGESNVITALETNVRNGIWEIEFDRCIRDMEELTIFITMPEVRALSVAGTGSITSTNIMVVNNINLSISGTGKIDIGIEANNVLSRISGTGNIVLEGKANDLEHTVSGVGDLRAFEMPTRSAQIRVSGTGDSEVSVSNNLNVRISGSGDVYYRGQPVIDVSVSGTGRLINAN